MNELLYIVWNPSLSIGPFRWYSLCWLIGLALAYFVVKRLYKEQNIKEELFDPLFFYCFIGILVGARLGHCIFYQPDYFLTSGKGFVEMLLPIHFLADGGWKFTGYEGLASHGGTLGLMIALWLYVRKTKLSIWMVLDNIAIATGITACFIRLGNLMNSEIIGKITDVPWAFIFERVDSYPRHPGQLYEAIAYAVLFAIMWWLHKKGMSVGKPQTTGHALQVGSGWYFGFCLTYIFTFRFFIEYTKEIQEAFEATLPIDMGQILSIPFIIIGIVCMLGGRWMKRLTMIAVLCLLSTHLSAQNTEQQQRYYDAFAQNNAEVFYAASKEAKDEMLAKGDRKHYYMFCINEASYEIRQGNSAKALMIANDVLKEMQENGDSHFDFVYNAMGSIYKNRGNYRMARRYFDMSVKYTQPNDTVSMIGSYLSIADLEASAHPDEALIWVDKLLPLCEKYPTHYNYVLGLKATACFFKNDSQHFFQTLEEYRIRQRESQFQDEQTDHLMETLRMAFDGDYEKAINRIYNDKIYDENIGRYDMTMQVYRMMNDKDKMMLEANKKYQAIDSLNANFIYENLNEMNAEIDLSKTQEKAAKDRTMLLSILVVLLVVVIGLLLWRYLTRHYLQKELIAQNKKLEIALSRAEESDRMKNSFIEHVSHEIRTPLNVITGYAQVITNPDYKLDTETREHMLNDISRNTVEITNIVNELLEVAQDESREHIDHDEMVAVNELCRHLIKDMESLNVHHLDIDFITDITDDYKMKTNKQAVDKILRQLLDNALKFTNEGKVELYVYDSPDHGTVRFIVTDTGIGISEEHQEHLYDRFFKADNFKPGFGLGLTMALKITTLLHGSLYLDKEYKEGARFILSLPTT